MNHLSDLVQRIRSCSSCAERREAMREAARKLRASLGLRSTLHARQMLSEQMLREQMGEQGKTRENP